MFYNCYFLFDHLILIVLYIRYLYLQYLIITLFILLNNNNSCFYIIVYAIYIIK